MVTSRAVVPTPGWYNREKKEEKKKRGTIYTTQIQGKCLQEVEQPMTEPALQYEPKQLSIFVHKATYCAFEKTKKFRN